MKKLFAIVVIILLPIQASCDRPEEYVKFSKLPLTEQHEKIRSLPINQQVDYYLYRMEDHHPPDRIFADDIAIQGELVLPYLLDRIEKEQADYRKVYLLQLFSTMHIKTIDLRKRKDVMSRLAEVVNKIENTQWKAGALETLDFIKEFTPKSTQ